MPSWRVYGKPYLLEAFTKLSKEIICFVMSVRLPLNGFSQNLISEDLSKISREN